MMSILIIVAHPKEDRFSFAMTDFNLYGGVDTSAKNTKEILEKIK